MQPRYDLAHLAVQFLDLSMGALSGTSVEMSDNSRALPRAKPYELLTGEADLRACLLQRHGRNFQAEVVKPLF